MPRTAPIDPSPRPVDPSPRLADPEGRSRTKQRTRDRLVKAADELFSSQGFDATTTADIAARADVSQRTLFRHFPTKEAVLYADTDDARFELRDILRGRPRDEPVLTSVREALLALGDDFESNRHRRLMQARLAATSPTVAAYSRAVIQASWEREIIVAVADRLGVDPMLDPRPEIVAGAALSAIRVATRQWTASDGTDDYLSHLDTALAAIPTLAELSDPV